MRLRSAIISILVVATIAGAFLIIDDTHDQTVGGVKTHVFPVIGSVTCNGLPATPINGELQYCSDCQMPSMPCQPGGTGAMAAYIDGTWECFPGGNAVVSTPTPVAFSCATPQVVQAYNGATSTTTCVTPSGGTCPAGTNAEVQYNDTGSCGADLQFQWAKGIYRLDILQPTPASTPTPNSVEFFITNNQNTSGSGAWSKVGNAGTSATADEGISFDSGVAGADRYLNEGRISDSGNEFRIISNSSFLPDVRTGTGWFYIDMANDQVLFKEMGTSSVPGIAWINDASTGVSFTSSGGLQRTIYHLINGVPSFQEEHVVTGENVVGISQRFRLIHAAPSPLTGAGPDVVIPTNALMELSTSNGAGTAVELDTTNIQEGDVVVIMNTAANDLTFTSASGANFCQKTNGGSTQTLAADSSNIKFIAHSSCWVQLGPVNDPS